MVKKQLCLSLNFLDSSVFSISVFTKQKKDVLLIYESSYFLVCYWKSSQTVSRGSPDLLVTCSQASFDTSDGFALLANSGTYIIF